MNLQRIKRVVVCAALVAMSFASAGLFQTGSVTGQETRPGTLHNAAAIERLKKDGQYESLQAAIEQARFSVSRKDATPLGRTAWHAPNSAAGYDAYITEAGVSIAVTDDSYVSLSLYGIGYGAALQSVGPGEVSGGGQTINLQREGGVREWYVNGPDGLEHGFTLNEPPGARQQGVPLRLALQVSAGWRAVASNDGKLVTLRGSHDQVVEYGKLVVRDNQGRNITARLAVADDQVVIEVEDSTAEYPLTIDPIFTLQQKLTAADGAATDLLGHSVALDGDTALVGAPYDDVTHQDQGSVYVFVRNGATWARQAQLKANDGASLDLFGWAVALDGDTALVGAYNGPGTAGPDQGAAYVFVRNGTTWTQQARLNASDGVAAGLFGTAVALDGDTALVGAADYRVNPNFAPGAAYVFVRNGTTWTEQARLTANDGSDQDRFGQSVALEGGTALIGAPADDVGTNANQGTAYIFTRNGTLWGARQRLTASNGAANDAFGNAVALSGETALIGAYLRFIDDLGLVYVFERRPTGWTETNAIGTTQRGTGAHLGVSVALDGNTAVIGASLGLFEPGVDQRSAYVFVRNGNYWGQVRHFGPELGTADDRFGYAVALDDDTVLVGAYRGDATATDQGAAYAFVLRDSRRVEQQKLTAHDGGANEYFGASVALDGDTLAVGAYTDTIGANAEQGSVYVFTRNGSGWTFQQKLTANDGAAYDYFGGAVALKRDTLVVGASYDDIGGNTDQGSAYVFKRNGTVWMQQQKLMAVAIDGLPKDRLGYAVSISGDTVAVGAPGVDNDRGAAYVFTRDGTVWKQQAKLSANDGAASDEFGYAVALSGETLTVGAPYDAIGANVEQGSVYVYSRSGTVWTRQTKLTASDGGLGDHFGAALALNVDAVVVGAPLDDNGAKTNQGSAYVFNRVGTAWIPAAKFIAPDGEADDRLGAAVALNDYNVAVGAVGDAIGANKGQGSVYLYTGISGYWYPQQKIIASDGSAYDYFGGAVAISGDTMVGGADRDAIGTNAKQGSVYVFASPPCPAITIAPDNLPNGMRGLSYNQQIVVSNDADAELHIGVSKGALPPGLTLDDNSGQLSGTPTVTGTYHFTITVTFFLSGCSYSRDYTLKVTPPCPTLTIYPATLPSGGLDTEYNIPLNVAGGLAPYNYSVTAGALPAGLSLSSAGMFSGAPTASGTFNFTVTATDVNGCEGTRAYTLVISGCFYTIAPTPQSFTAISQTGGVTVATTASCSWTAQSNNSWIKLSNFGGKGSGTIQFTVAANSGPERTGTITIAGQTATLMQAALPSETPRLSRLTPNAASMGTNGLVLTVTGTSFTTSQRVQWNGINYETSFVSATELRAVIPAAELAREGTAAVVVVDTANGARSNLSKFRIIGAVAHASAASYNTVTLAPDSIVAAFGTDLAGEVRVANSLPLPTELAGTTVTISDSQGTAVRAPLFFVAPTQINYLMPPGLANGIATVTINNGRGVEIKSLTEITRVAPGLFSINASGEGVAAATVFRIRANGEQVYEPVARFDAETQTYVLTPIGVDNAAEQVYLILFGTGIRHHDSLEEVMIKLGEMQLPVAYAGKAPEFEGVDQVNVLLPASLRGLGEQTLMLRVKDETSNGVKVRFQ